MSVHFTFFIFYNNTICAMMCLCVSLSWVQPTGTLESCFKVHAVFWCRAFAGCSADAERCRAFQKADDETNEQLCISITFIVDVQWLTQRADNPVYCTCTVQFTVQPRAPSVNTECCRFVTKLMVHRVKTTALNNDYTT